MRSPDAATTRLDDYIGNMLPWAHGHPRKGIRDFVQAIIAQQTGCQAQLARSFGNQEALCTRGHSPGGDACHPDSAVGYPL
jgi:hypothetical protein